MSGKRLAGAFGTCRLDRFCHRRYFFGLIDLEVLDRQFALSDLLIELLKFAAKQLAARGAKLDSYVLIIIRSRRKYLSVDSYRPLH
ncbi:hypothetical protein SAMN06295970_1531 [Noviherbaspirillum suwonense]|uniref:Transposase InsH N-terminal domain-containing protein n=2 Tax=Noviherbaspirillum suwonense TaxID=1224511 RepID=A0ABY1QW62_9BURK|nr:hypothetical protein SAMN06295970_1531 [Noviherbaspirillum suwonense]